MNLFESVKSSITTREAAEHYGIHVGRSGMCRCPFHNDRIPSMKADERFHCFGCQADGDVISFTSRLFDLSPKDAALKLASDFGIAYAFLRQKRLGIGLFSFGVGVSPNGECASILHNRRACSA